MDIFAQYATDDTAEKEGVWVPHGDAKFLIARAGNRKYVKRLSEAYTENEVLLDIKNEAADALSDKIMIDVIANTILLGWENVSFNDTPLEYSEANAKTILAVKDFRKLVMKWSDDMARFKVKQLEATVKN